MNVNQCSEKKVRAVVPAEVPNDTRICIEDLVDTDFDESDVDELRAEKKKTAREPLNKRAVPTAGRSPSSPKRTPNGTNCTEL